MIIVPKEYLLAKFRQYSGNPVKKGDNWNASCPVCREGKHWLDKKRLFYLTKENYLYCHNCSLSWNPLQWIKEITAMDYPQIVQEIQAEGYDCFEKEEVLSTPKKPVEDLPKNSIDLTNPHQLEFYKDNKVVKDCLKLIKDRRLDTALNSCEKYWVSLDDYKYRNRVIIPYKDFNNRINFYTSRGLYKNQDPKYLNKFGEKEVFNLHKVDSNFPYIFVFEGQIDSMFIKNGVAVSGVVLTDYQTNLIKNKFPDHELIWVLDNPRLDNTSKKIIKSRVKFDQNFRCFVYPDEYSNCKDMNIFCMQNKLDSVDVNEFLNNCKRGNSILFNI